MGGDSQTHSKSYSVELSNSDGLSYRHLPLDENNVRDSATDATRQRPSFSSSSSSTTMSPVLPRVNRDGYLRVDADNGKGGPSRIRFGWKRFAIAATVIIGFVWLFGPRERRESVIESITPSWNKPTRPPPIVSSGDDETPSQDSKLGDSASQNSPGKTVVLPHSPAEDPDLTKTVHCVRPYSPDARIVQFALMIDAGSTGSRIHIYKFNNCGPSAEYEYEVFKMTKPGLSSYKDDPLAAATSLDVLLDEAVRVVPQSLWSCTPVAVKATAGLRLLGSKQSEDILEAVRRRLQENYPFSVVSKEKDGVAIMDGKDEGVYAWITANYLLNTIRADSPKKEHSYAVLDLGGASTQIVFEPDFSDDKLFVDGDHKYELDFGGKKHTLYQHSYLGYGLMRARKSVHRLVEFMASFNQPPANGPSRPSGEIPNPCLYRGSSRLVELEATLPGEEDRSVTMVGADVGSFEACNRVIELVMAKDSICQTKPCSFNGVYQPSILETFASGKVLLLSYFYDRIAPFYPGSDSDPSKIPPLTVNTIATLARDVCGGSQAWQKAAWGGDIALRAELEDRPEWCLDLTLMHALLRLGYEFPADRGIRIEKQIDGTELGWCLGAAIAVVGGELTCRI